MSHARCNIFADMGMGKTLAGLTIAEYKRLCGWDRPTLVLAPLRVARDTWPNEARKWNHLQHLRIQPVIGTAVQRRAALWAEADIYTCNYENIPWLVEQLGSNWPFGGVIADESTRLKNYRLAKTKKDGSLSDKGPGGKRTTALATVARDADWWINLTGTPAPNGLKDLWGQQWFVDHGATLGRTHTSFMERWFRTDEYTREVKPLEHAFKQIQDAMRPSTIAIRCEDWFDLEKPVVRTVYVDFPPDVRRRYRELERQMFTKLQCGTEVEVFNAAALTNKCMQFANGMLYIGEDKIRAPAHDLKLDALESILNEAGGTPLLVAYQFQSDRDRILHRFKSAVDISTKAGFAKFMAGDAAIGIAHPASMGHGIDGLQDATNILVRFGHGWDLEHRLQMLERIGPMRQKQNGHERNVLVYDIVARDTIDEDVLLRHESKQEVQDLLLTAMKRRG